MAKVVANENGGQGWECMAAHSAATKRGRVHEEWTRAVSSNAGSWSQSSVEEEEMIRVAPKAQGASEQSP